MYTPPKRIISMSRIRHSLRTITLFRLHLPHIPLHLRMFLCSRVLRVLRRQMRRRIRLRSLKMTAAMKLPLNKHNFNI